ncbi:hypothetical protein F0Q45_03375 [Mycobacterium simiae]|uniref:Uncharacterized protein n=1 Tax=Mycobacterium simiae TaxID=1784 RepID=A0A5B1BWA1_MYCSI|nr:hypothetical protein F0Q45_03375 [Mycobacterium simiae]
MVVGVGEQQRVLLPGVGDAVALAAGDAFDEAVGTQARVPESVTRGVVRSVKALAPRIGSRLMVWTPSRRRLAE